MNVSNGEMESLNKMGEKPTQPWINNDKCDFGRTPSEDFPDAPAIMVNKLKNTSMGDFHGFPYVSG